MTSEKQKLKLRLKSTGSNQSFHFHFGENTQEKNLDNVTMTFILCHLMILRDRMQFIFFKSLLVCFTVSLLSNLNHKYEFLLLKLPIPRMADDMKCGAWVVWRHGANKIGGFAQQLDQELVLFYDELKFTCKCELRTKFMVPYV